MVKDFGLQGLGIQKKCRSPCDGFKGMAVAS